jgi:hypothetical protein
VHPLPEGLLDAGGQLDQPAGRPADRRRGAEQLAQQGVVHVGAPRQPGEAHLDGDQGARGLGGDEGAHAAGPGREPMRGREIGQRRRAGPLGGIDVRQDRERRSGRLEVEERVLRVAGRRRGPRRWIGRDGTARQPGAGGGRRAGLPPGALGTQQERLGQLEVVAALDAKPSPYQTGIDLGS